MSDSMHLIQGYASVRQAAQEMARLNIGLLVILQEGKISGTLTERDITRRVVGESRSGEVTRVSEVMTTPVVCLYSGATITEACTLMRNENLKYIPIIDEDSQPIGILGITDLVAFFANNAELTDIYDGA